MDTTSTRRAKSWRPDMLMIVLLIAGYFLLTWVILPKLGVPT
jgi:hypothetical protein